MTSIRRELHAGAVYLVAFYRGTQYTLRRSRWGWELTTRRQSLGRFNAGGFRRFDTLADVQAKCRAFANLDPLTAY